MAQAASACRCQRSLRRHSGARDQPEARTLISQERVRSTTGLTGATRNRKRKAGTAAPPARPRAPGARTSCRNSSRLSTDDVEPKEPARRSGSIPARAPGPRNAFWLSQYPHSTPPLSLAPLSFPSLPLPPPPLRPVLRRRVARGGRPGGVAMRRPGGGMRCPASAPGAASGPGRSAARLGRFGGAAGEVGGGGGAVGRRGGGGAAVAERERATFVRTW